MDREDATPATGRSHADGLLVVIGPSHLEAHPFPVGTSLVLGRDSRADVRLDHRKVSRRHATIRWSAAFARHPCVVLHDLGSTNGIVVGTRRVAAGATIVLQVGERFAIGPFVLVVATTSPRA